MAGPAILAGVASASPRVLVVALAPVVLAAPFAALALWALLFLALRLSCGASTRLGELAAWSFLPLLVSGALAVILSALVGLAASIGAGRADLHGAPTLLIDASLLLASAASVWLVFVGVSSLAPSRAAVGTAFVSALLAIVVLGELLAAYVWSAA
jgi:hypothetical protein